MGPMELATSASGQLNDKDEFITRITEIYVLCRYSTNTDRQQELAELVKSFKLHPAS
jgi:hypothetical protein